MHFNGIYLPKEWIKSGSVDIDDPGGVVGQELNCFLLRLLVHSLLPRRDLVASCFVFFLLITQ